MTAPNPLRTTEALAMPERDLTAAAIELAQLLGWRVAHFRPALTHRGWRTAVQGDGVGWPDLLAVRGDRIVAIELKAERGKLTDEQREWLEKLAAAGAATHVFRPSDWFAGELERVLR